MKNARLEPAKSVIEKIGIETAASVTGKHVSRIYRWMSPRTKGGTDGYIPPTDAELLLQHAHANDIDLNPEDFFVTRPTGSVSVRKQMKPKAEAGAR